jgi:hypothetical protein
LSTSAFDALEKRTSFLRGSGMTEELSDKKPQGLSPEGLSPVQAGELFACMLVGVLLALALTFLLPDNKYIRWQQANASVMFHLQWIYERITFDAAPIDIAIVGASRLEAAISPVILSDALGQDPNPVHAANLSLVLPGRDLTFSVAEILLERHPETKLVVLAADGDTKFSHTLFRYVADPGELVRAPLLLNIKYFQNLLFLPYCNLEIAAQSIFPSAFGVSLQFDREKPRHEPRSVPWLRSANR